MQHFVVDAGVTGEECIGEMCDCEAVTENCTALTYNIMDSNISDSQICE